MRLVCTFLVVLALFFVNVRGFTFLGKLKMPDLNKIINPPTDKFQVQLIAYLLTYSLLLSYSLAYSLISSLIITQLLITYSLISLYAFT